ncbi:HNH endonuclease family protein [Nostocoides vanveenii]|uniref:HNH nuclease domain-containing protein n=1 Tax=Nostocoides vanveenii TaxID=330835 RepID=A0ABP4WQB1_9MICO
MKIDLNRIPIREVVKDYSDDGEGGVRGYEGSLNIRPPYQREFIYDDKKREAVLQTIRRGFPLNVMYWAVNDDGTFEVLDGQQRTIALCQYVAGDFSVTIDGRPMAFHNLTQPQKDTILDYELMVYLCQGDDKEKLDWFETINIAGERLTPQELRNAVYTGPWLSHAKSIFSKTNGPAYGLASRYVSGSPIRQELLEKALKWKSDGKIENYMSAHQHDQNANELWAYFRAVVQWVQDTFTTYRKEMKSVEWGPLYDAYHNEHFDTDDLERRTADLIQDPDVTKHRGIYTYLLTSDPRHLSIRQFDTRERLTAYERQGHRCANGTHCKTPGNDNGQMQFSIEQMEADHITPWSKGGKTIADNCQMLCIPCNRDKGGL